VYYPPPPPPGLETPGKGSYDVAYGGSSSHGDESPYKALINEGVAAAVNSSSYHDSYGAAGVSVGGGASKRPAGAPQGGSTVEPPVVTGAPQAILQ
jgi:hypothetical protein